MKKLIWLVVAIALQAIPLAQGQTITDTITASGTTCGSTNCTRMLLQPNSNIGTVVIQVTGTFTATMQFEASSNPNDETSYVAINGVPVGSNVPASSATAAGLWQFAAAGILAIQVRASAYTSGTANVYMQLATMTPQLPTVSGALTLGGQPIAVTGSTSGTPVTVSFQTAAPSVNAATNSAGRAAIVAADTSRSISISTAGNTQVITGNNTTSIYITGIGFTIATTTATGQTVQLVSGTGTTCLTAQTVITGAYSGATASSISGSGGTIPTVINRGGGLGMIWSVPTNLNVCAITTGTQPVSGDISFAQFLKMLESDDREWIGELYRPPSEEWIWLH